jgi:hypothetical protein
MLSHTELKSGDVVWEPINNYMLEVIDPVVVGDWVECQIKGFNLDFMLLWVPSSLMYGPHYKFQVITPEIESLEAWEEYREEYNRFWYGR